MSEVYPKNQSHPFEDGSYYRHSHHEMAQHKQRLGNLGDGDRISAVQHTVYMKLWSVAPFMFNNWSLQAVEGLLSALVITTALSVLRDCLVHSLYIDEKNIAVLRELTLRNVSAMIRRAGLHMLNTGIAYILMLCVMTYNIWLFGTVILGAGLGHYFLRPVIEWAYYNSVVATSQQKANTFSLATTFKTPVQEMSPSNDNSKIETKHDYFPLPEESEKLTSLQKSLLTDSQK